MGQAPQVGQTGWGQAAQAMNTGYNTLAMYNEMEHQREMQDYQMQQSAQDTAMRQDVARAGIKAGEAQTADTSRRTAIAEKGQTISVMQHEKDSKDRLDMFDRELALRQKMSKDQLDADREKTQVQLQMAKDKLAQDKNDAAALASYREAEIKLRANENATRAEYYRGQNKADMVRAGAAATSAGNESRRTNAELKGEMNPQVAAKIWADAAEKVYGDPLNTGKSPEELQGLVARIAQTAIAEGQKFSRGAAPTTSGPDPNLPDGTKVRGPDGNIYTMQGGKPIPDAKGGGMQPGEFRLDEKPKKRAKIFPNE